MTLSSTGAPKVVVVGSGLAGLTAALACADRGARVTLLEARARLGGSTFSFIRDGLTVDNGQHVFLRCCTAYRAFLRRIHAEGMTTMQPRLCVPVVAPGGRTGRLRRGGLPPPLHIAGSLARYPFISSADRWGLIRAVRDLARLDPDDPALDRRTFGQWLAEHRQSPRAVEALWSLLGLPTLNLDPRDASLALAVKVFKTAFLSDRAASDIGYARVSLSSIHGEAASRALHAAGVEVRLRTPARELRAEGVGGLVVWSADTPWEADAVVLAVPHQAAAGLFPPGALVGAHLLVRLGASPIVNLHVVYDRRITALPFAAGLGSPVQWVFDRTRSAGLERGQYLVVSLSAAEREIAERTGSLRARFLPALADLFPRASVAKVERFFVTRERAATFRQAAGTRELRPGPRTAVPGLAVAGSWTDTGWPDTMEGAVRSGQAAAREALLSVGRVRSLPEAVVA